MATLYKRATIPQARMLRIVEGAVKNVADKRGDRFDPTYARSVAKRAVGTLTAQMPDVLAATKVPSGWEPVTACSPTAPAQRDKINSRVRLAQLRQRAKRVRSELSRPDPLTLLESNLRRQMRGIKLRREEEKAGAFIEVLRMIAKLKIRETDS